MMWMTSSFRISPVGYASKEIWGEVTTTSRSGQRRANRLVWGVDQGLQPQGSQRRQPKIEQKHRTGRRAHAPQAGDQPIQPTV
jgi:hypothetical protein